MSSSLNKAKRNAMTVQEAWKVAIEAMRLDMIKRLRAYDTRNHRGQYAVLCRDAAELLELMGRHCK